MNAVALDPHTELEMLRAEITKRDAEIRKRDAQIRDRDAEIAKHETVLGKRDREIRLQAARIEQLAQVIAKFQRMQFAARSEKFDPTQQALFDDAFGADLGATQAELDVLRTTPRERAQPKRQPLPPKLPRVEERIEPASCTCSACGGELHCIGEEVSEKLDVKPIEFFVRKIIRAKLACRGCETIHTPPALPALIERGIAAPGLLAHVLIGKYADHLPLYRQSDMLARSGVTLPVSTLSEWVGATGFALQPLVDALRSELHRSSVLHADETPVQLLTPGKGRTQTAYLFAYRRGEIDEPPIIVYDFAENRSGANARRFLADYGGALVVDDYAGYKSLFQSTPMREIGCWAHARRKFFELHEANKSTLAAEALTRIGAIYAVEREADGMNHDARHANREQYARPKIDALFGWLEGLRPKINSGSATAKAFDYLLRRKAAFMAYLDDGRFPIDNNPVENAIRPVALGRKNWLFAGSALAGQRAANIMSLIQSAKANSHDPHAYLRDVLTRLPTQLNSRIGDLLPHSWQPATA
jgi:transposase